MSRARSFVAALFVSAVLLPVSGHAATCPKVHVISGVATGIPNPMTGNDVRAGINVGGAGSGCDPAGAVSPPLFVLTPGATAAWAGILRSDSPSLPSGTMTVTSATAGTTTTTLSFRLNSFERPFPLTPRWESQSVLIPPGTTTVTVSSSVGSVTYKLTP